MEFSESLVSFLGDPAVSTTLLVIAFSCVAMEIIFAGTGAFAGLGIASFVLYFMGGLMTSFSSWLAIILIVAAVVLFLMELFVIPGFGICGVLSVLSMFAAVVVVAPSMEIALMQIVLALVVAIAIVVVSLKCGKTRRVWNKLILSEKTTTDKGYLSQPLNINDLVGKTGVAATSLRPAGAAMIDDERIDVITEGIFIDAGENVKVVKVDGSSVIVVRI